MSRTIRVSDHVYERIEGIKERHDHLTMDGVLREIIGSYTIQEETEKRSHAFEYFAQTVYDDLDDAIYMIALHGSTARGEANSTSDVDVFVVLDEQETENESEHRDVIMKYAFEIGSLEHGVGIMPSIVTHERYEERKSSSFVSTVLEEGRVFRPGLTPTAEGDA
jgi:predicted nucleotidyltransferase